MKKRISTIILLLCTILSSYAQQTDYVISGTTKANTKKVFLYEHATKKAIDSTYCTNGKFQFSGKQPYNAFLIVTDKNKIVAVVNDRTHITVDLNNKNVTGSPLNVQFGNFQKKVDESEQKSDEMFQEWKNLLKDKTVEGITKAKNMEKSMYQLDKKFQKNLYDFCLKNKNNVLPAYFLGNYYFIFNYDELKNLLDKSAVYADSPVLKKAFRQMQALEKRKTGLTFTDLTMRDMDGKVSKLSQWAGKGRYVLVDFWASWCGPCRAEMPNVVESYKRYHNAKGYEIVGVSFDKNAESWKKAVKDLHMTWPQISDLQGWNSAAHNVYGINSIPSNILLDPSGKIIASDLRGEELTEKLKDIFGY